MLCSLRASQFYTAIYLRGVLLYLIKDIFDEKFKKNNNNNDIIIFLNFSLNIYLCITNYNNTPHTIHGSVQLSCL